MSELVGKDGLPVVLFETKELWAAWLEQNAGTTGIWVRLAKKNSGVKSIDYFQALEVALCYGWIDGIKKTWVPSETGIPAAKYFGMGATPEASFALESGL